MSIAATMKAVVFKIQWSLNGYKNIRPKNFPIGISLMQKGNYCGLFIKKTNTLLTSVCYQKITYDEKGGNFMGYENRKTHLITHEGKVIFSTTRIKNPEFQEYLTPNGEGNYLYITNNHITGRGRLLKVSNKGKIMTKPDYYFLFQC